MEGREKGRRKGRKEKMGSTDMLERELRIVLQAPNPSRRDAFLAEAPRFYMGHGSFVLAQAAYIRKWVWVISVILLGALADIAARWPRESLWVAAGMMPFLALTAMQEHLRSSMYNMTELELSTRFSVKSILLARMGLLGSFHLILLLLLLPFLVLQGQTGLLHTGIYLLVPYLLTTFLSMVLARKVRGRESLYLCFGAAVLVSSLQVLGSKAVNWYSDKLFIWWLLALSVLLAGNVWEYYQAANRADSIYEKASV